MATDLNKHYEELICERDQLIRDSAIEQYKLGESYKTLRELGIENPDKLSTDELEQIKNNLEVQLEVALTNFEERLSKGEAQLAEYQHLSRATSPVAHDPDPITDDFLYRYGSLPLRELS